MVGGPWNIQESQADHDHCSDRVYDVVINPADHCVGSGEGSGAQSVHSNTLSRLAGACALVSISSCVGSSPENPR